MSQYFPEKWTNQPTKQVSFTLYFYKFLLVGSSSLNSICRLELFSSCGVSLVLPECCELVDTLGRSLMVIWLISVMRLKKDSKMKGLFGSMMESFIQLWLQASQPVQQLTIFWIKQIAVRNIHVESHDCVFYYSNKSVAFEASTVYTCLILQCF